MAVGRSAGVLGSEMQRVAVEAARGRACQRGTSRSRAPPPLFPRDGGFDGCAQSFVNWIGDDSFLGEGRDDGGGWGGTPRSARGLAMMDGHWICLDGARDPVSAIDLRLAVGVRALLNSMPARR